MKVKRMKRILLEIDIDEQQSKKHAELVAQLNILLLQIFGPFQAERNVRLKVYANDLHLHHVKEPVSEYGPGNMANRTENIFQIGSMAFNIQGTENCNNDFINRCIKIMGEHIGDSGFNMLRLAHHLNLSKPTFYRRVKTITGVSAKVFMKTIKMHIAFQLLQTKSYTVSEVAWKCGYNSARHFSKLFYEVFGKYPSKVELQRMPLGNSFEPNRSNARGSIL
jgi:transcriptional regulator GlxA family with amidase domain